MRTAVAAHQAVTYVATRQLTSPPDRPKSRNLGGQPRHVARFGRVHVAGAERGDDGYAERVGGPALPQGVLTGPRLEDGGGRLAHWETCRKIRVTVVHVDHLMPIPKMSTCAWWLQQGQIGQVIRLKPNVARGQADPTGVSDAHKQPGTPRSARASGEPTWFGPFR